jgi:hypothetical protein
MVGVQPSQSTRNARQEAVARLNLVQQSYDATLRNKNTNPGAVKAARAALRDVQIEVAKLLPKIGEDCL